MIDGCHVRLHPSLAPAPRHDGAPAEITGHRSQVKHRTTYATWIASYAEELKNPHEYRTHANRKWKHVIHDRPLQNSRRVTSRLQQPLKANASFVVVSKSERRKELGRRELENGAVMDSDNRSNTNRATITKIGGGEQLTSISLSYVCALLNSVEQRWRDHVTRPRVQLAIS